MAISRSVIVPVIRYLSPYQIQDPEIDLLDLNDRLASPPELPGFVEAFSIRSQKRDI